MLEEALALRAAGFTERGAGLAVDAATRPRRCGRALGRRRRHLGVRSLARRWSWWWPPPPSSAARPGCTSRSTPACPATAPPPADWPDAGRGRGRRPPAGGVIEAAGIWSHFVYADSPGHPTTAAADRAVRRGAARSPTGPGWCPRCGTWPTRPPPSRLPQAHFDLVRPGIAVYGLSPVPGPGRLRPGAGDDAAQPAAPTSSGSPAGEGVSYGHQYRARRATARWRLVPLGYADGVPRAATNVGPVQISGRRYTISGRVCMDQFVVDLGDDQAARAATRSVLFGPGADGEPTAQDWADALDTIHYEIVTRIGARVPRSYLGGEPVVRIGEVRPGRRRGRPDRCGRGGRRSCRQRRPVGRATGRRIDPQSAGAAATQPVDRSGLVRADDGVGLHAEEVGPVDAPLTVAVRARVHPATWVVRTFSGGHSRAEFGDRVRLVFYDQRSHGRSERSRPPRTAPSSSSAATWTA